MIIRDTDALGPLQKRDSVGVLIELQLDASLDRDIRITVINVYEMLGGAISLIDRRKKERRDVIPAFHLLLDLIEYLKHWQGLILPYETASDEIRGDFPARMRQELKEDARIAAIALAHNAAIWTCNVSDYKKVPGLTVIEADTGTIHR